MPFQRRLFLYLIGLVIGGFLAYFFMGDRLTNMKWTPKERIKLRLRTTLVKSTPAAERAMQDWPTDLPTVKEGIPKAEVLLDRTERGGDSLFYHLEMDVAGRPALVKVLVSSDLAKDTTATLWMLEPR